MKSKYNTGVPMDISKLSDEERKQAFHEWAEGSEALEKLLIAGYNRGFLSHACCGGDTGHPYISYDLADEHSRKMAISVAEQLVNSELDCSVSIYDDFDLNDFDPKQFPTRNITDLNVYARMDNKEELFSLMAKHIEEAQLEKVQLPVSRSQIPSKEFKKEIDSKATTFINELGSKTYDEGELAINDATNSEPENTQKSVAKEDRIV